MADLSPAQAARALDAVAEALPGALRDVLGYGAVRIGGNAVGRMRDAKGEGRRDPDDSGPLRILTGTHAAATIADGPNRRGALNRVAVRGAVATLEKGYDLDADPGAWNEVRDDRARYRTLVPALEGEADAVRKFAEDRLEAMLREAVGAR